MKNCRRMSLYLFLVLAGVMGVSSMAVAETKNLVFQVKAPDSTPGPDIYLAGNFQGWNPGNNDHRLNDLGGGTYEISLMVEAGQQLQFKFTQGNWATVEKGPAGEEISNRVLRVEESGTYTFHIAAWADGIAGHQKKSTITGNVQPVDLPGFLGGREVLVYLPPDYHKKQTKRFPVLYMLDGQNVFDAATSFAGEWEVDESCEKLITQEKMRPVIVVSIANGADRRVNEYTPWPDPNFRNGDAGGGKQHLQTIVDELLPHVNATYRTLTGPRNTGLGGSSLGGLMALFAAGEHQKTFGLLAAVSPCLWWNQGFPVNFAKDNILPGIKLYVDMGGLEDGPGKQKNNPSLDALQILKETLENGGFESGKNLMVVAEASGEHNEATWARRFPAALAFLFPKEETDSDK